MMNKRIIGFTIIYVLLFIGAIQMYFDEDPFNNHIGGLFLGAFWLFRGIQMMIDDVLDEKRKSAIFNLFFVIVAGGALVWGVEDSTVYLKNGSFYKWKEI